MTTLIKLVCATSLIALGASSAAFGGDIASFQDKEPPKKEAPKQDGKEKAADKKEDKKDGDKEKRKRNRSLKNTLR